MVAFPCFCDSVNRHEYTCHDNDVTDKMKAKTAITVVIHPRNSDIRYFRCSESWCVRYLLPSSDITYLPSDINWPYSSASPLLYSRTKGKKLSLILNFGYRGSPLDNCLKNFISSFVSTTFLYNIQPNPFYCDVDRHKPNGHLNSTTFRGGLSMTTSNKLC